MVRYTLFMILITLITFGKDLPTIQIDTVFDGKGDISEKMLTQLKYEVDQLIHGEYQIIWRKSCYGTYQPKSIQKCYQEALNNQESNLVITMGLIGSNMILKEQKFPKPVIAPFTIDFEIKHLQKKRQPIKNLNYLTLESDIWKDFATFRRIFPFKKLVLLIDADYLSVMAQRIKLLQKRAVTKGFSIKVLPAIDNINQIISKLDPDDQALFMTPIPRLSDEKLRRLTQKLNERGVAIFSRTLPKLLPYGMLAVLESPDYQTKITRQIALNIQSIQLGERPEDLSVILRSDQQLKLNMEAVRKLDISPNFEILEEAELINEKNRSIKKVWSFSEALKHGVKVNLDLMIKKHEASVQKESIRTAWTNYLPKVEASLTGVMIDDDRAAAGMGLAPEQQLFGKLSITQLIYSNDALANIDIQKDLVKEKKYLIEQTKEDIARDIAVAYLNIMRAKTYERIMKNNIKLTRKHIEMAKIRKRVGTASPGEIYQWEAQLALNRKDAAKAKSKRRMAEMMLNRLLNRPLEERFQTREISLTDPTLLTGYGSVKHYIKNEKTFKRLRDFLVKDGLESAYELKRIDQGINAQKKVKKMIKRRFWLPTVGFKGEMSYRFYKGGSGADGLSSIDLKLPPSLIQLIGLETAMALANAIPEEKNDLDWSLALNVSFPLFNQGKRFVDQDKHSKKLAKLYLERQSIVQKLSQLIRSRAEEAGYTYGAIKFSTDAALSAHKGYDVVKDAYQKGMTSMIHLMDIQNKALSADLIAANAHYDFLIDLIKLQRAIGKVNFSHREIDQKKWIQKLKQSIEKR